MFESYRKNLDISEASFYTLDRPEIMANHHCCRVRVLYFTTSSVVFRPRTRGVLDITEYVTMGAPPTSQG